MNEAKKNNLARVLTLLRRGPGPAGSFEQPQELVRLFLWSLPFLFFDLSARRC